MNSSVRSYDQLDEQLEPCAHIFSQQTDIAMNFSLFKYIVENSSNKNVNINELCKQAGTDIINLHQIVEMVRPHLKDQRIKTRMTKLANLLFQIMPSNV